uniref:Uncharacterized protein n=1 Tax=Toxoplasma gondii TgCATBr9 TaxID=943120 RepID=A0A2T6INZ0_TOXGO|nr:hypothetical protein TGBR9_239270A [Toxoplasma gondii TgCATBr9]
MNERYPAVFASLWPRNLAPTASTIFQWNVVEEALHERNKFRLHRFLRDIEKAESDRSLERCLSVILSSKFLTAFSSYVRSYFPADRVLLPRTSLLRSQWRASTMEANLLRRGGFTGEQANALLDAVTLDLVQHSSRMLALHHRSPLSMALKFAAIVEGFYSAINAGDISLLSVFRRHLMSNPELRKAFSKNSKVLSFIDKHRSPDARPRDLLQPWVPPGADAATLAGLEDHLNLPIQWSRLESTFTEYFNSITQPGSGFDPSAFLDHSVGSFNEVKEALMHLSKQPRRLITLHIVSAILSQAALAQFHVSRFDALVQAQSFQVTPQFVTAALGRNKLTETIRKSVVTKLGITFEPEVVKEMLEHLFCKASGGAVLDVVHGQGTATGSVHALNEVDRQAALSMAPDLLVLLFDVWLAERPELRAQLAEDSMALLLLPSNNPAIVTRRLLVARDVSPTQELDEFAVAMSPLEELATVVEPLVRFEELPPDSEAGRWASEMKVAVIRRLKILSKVKSGFRMAPHKEVKRVLQHLVVNDFALGHYTYLAKAYNIFERAPDLKPVVADMLSFSEHHWRRLGVDGELALSLRRLLLGDLVDAFCDYHSDAIMAPRTPYMLFHSVFGEVTVFVRIWDVVNPLLEWDDAHPGVLESVAVNQPSLLVQFINETPADSINGFCTSFLAVI